MYIWDFYNYIHWNPLINLLANHREIFIKNGDGCDVWVCVLLSGVYGLTSLEAYKTSAMDSSFHLSSMLECKVLEDGVRGESVQLFIAGTSSMPETEQTFSKRLLKERMS